MAEYIRKPQKPMVGFKWTGEKSSNPAWAAEEGVRQHGDRIQVSNAAGALYAHIGDHVIRRKPGDCYVVEAEHVDELFDIKD